MFSVHVLSLPNEQDNWLIAQYTPLTLPHQGAIATEMVHVVKQQPNQVSNILNSKN